MSVLLPHITWALAEADGAPEAITWATGLVDAAGAPTGLLLSDNEGYWGESILTGVDYRYQSEADNPIDRIGSQGDAFGRRLLDGRIGGNWHVPVGQSRGPLIVVFDFKRPCTFTEVNTIATRSPLTSLTVEVSDTGNDGNWRTVFAEPLDAATEQPLRRARLPAESSARYLRLSIEASGITYLDEVIVWGHGEVSENFPEHLAPTCAADLPGDMLESIAGAITTRFSRSHFDDWRSHIGSHAKAPVVWTTLDSPDLTGPILPEADAIAAPPRLLVARNETESAYLALVNTSADTELKLTLDPPQFHAATIQAELLIGGAIPAMPPKQRLTAEERLRLMVDNTLPQSATGEGDATDVRLLPFFAADNMLGRSHMAKYLINGVAIRDFPRLTIAPGGSAVLMLRITTDSALPGQYAASLSATTHDGRVIAMPLQVEVADILLPELDLWVRSWGNGTNQFPFESQGRLANDALVNRKLGVTVWPGFPTPGSKAALFGSHGKSYYRVKGVPSYYTHVGYTNKLQAEELTAEDEGKIIAFVNDQVREARELGLDYDAWWVELWDEPQEKNVALFGALARLIKRTDPRVRIYMNPLFWRPGHAPPEVVVEHLAPWYNDLVDISVPVTTLVGDNVSTRELWSQPRFVRAFFIHPAERGGRAMAWRAFDLGFNGWGYYCYYAPRGNPWDIRTWSQLNYRYQMVFPGPGGPIIMPIYEIMRDGWEDYHLLSELRRLGRGELVDSLLDGWRQGEAPAALRLRALEAVRLQP